MPPTDGHQNGKISAIQTVAERAANCQSQNARNRVSVLGRRDRPPTSKSECGRSDERAQSRLLRQLRLQKLHQKDFNSVFLEQCKHPERKPQRQKVSNGMKDWSGSPALNSSSVSTLHHHSIITSLLPGAIQHGPHKRPLRAPNRPMPRQHSPKLPLRALQRFPLSMHRA